jgi:hypothetical protein
MPDLQLLRFIDLEIDTDGESIVNFEVQLIYKNMG